MSHASADAVQTIGALVQGDVPARMIVGILVVKAVIWSVSLGSGTSGGVLAPLTRYDLSELVNRAAHDPAARLETILRTTPTVAHPDEPLRVVVHRMAETGLTHFRSWSAARTSVCSA
jgi:hypothetical protein